LIEGRLDWGAPHLSGVSEEMTETLWKCVQLRAGQVYNKVVFNSRDEAEKFVAQMRRMEPDLFWMMEPVEAKLVWN
jgi:hypothetical protein